MWSLFDPPKGLLTKLLLVSLQFQSSLSSTNWGNTLFTGWTIVCFIWYGYRTWSCFCSQYSNLSMLSLYIYIYSLLPCLSKKKIPFAILKYNEYCSPIGYCPCQLVPSPRGYGGDSLGFLFQKFGEGDSFWNVSLKNDIHFTK